MKTENTKSQRSNDSWSIEEQGELDGDPGNLNVGPGNGHAAVQRVKVHVVLPVVRRRRKG